ncbi:hypothetical protein Y699_06040 [Aspergillus fumigatus Z5]|nr:hypothetical protein Y699_06040 [Aspergillus fumigatus Z5]
MSDIVRPSKETYDSVLRESYNLWLLYLDADDSRTLPFHCIELRNILSQILSFLAHGPIVQGLYGHDKGNYATVLLLAWAYILSIQWSKLLSHSSNH